MYGGNGRTLTDEVLTGVWNSNDYKIQITFLYNRTGVNRVRRISAIVAKDLPDGRRIRVDKK